MNQLLIKRRSIFFLLTVMYFIPSYAQTNFLDTLKSSTFFYKKYGDSLKLKSDSVMLYYENFIVKPTTYKDSLQNLTVLVNLAEIFLLTNDNLVCLQYLQKADSFVNESKFKIHDQYYKLIKCYTKAYYNTREYKKVIKYANKALNIYQLNSYLDKNDLLQIYYKLSTSYVYTQKFDSVLTYINKSDSLINTSPSPDLFYTFNNIWKRGLVLNNRGNTNEALKVLLKSVANIGEQDYSSQVAIIYSSIGNIYLTLRELDKSVQYFNQAIKTYQQLGLPFYPYITNIYASMARAYILMDYNNEALELLNESIKYNLKNNDPRVINDYQIIGSVYMAMDSLNLANKFLKASVETLNKIYQNKYQMRNANFTFYYGHFLIEKMHDKKGVELTNQAIEIYRTLFGEKHPSLADCYNYLGKAKILIDKNPDEALEYLQKALIANDKTFDNPDIKSNPKIENAMSKKFLITILTDKANALKEKITASSNQKDMIENIELMNNTLLLAIQTIDFIRTSFTSVDSKLKMNEKTASLYAELISSSLQLYQITGNKKYLLNSYEYVANSKTATLNGLINEDISKITAGIPQKILEREKELRIQKGELDNQLRNLELSKEEDKDKKDRIENELFKTNQEIDLLTANFEKNYPNYFQLKYKNESLGVAQLQKHLTKDQVVLEYFVSDTALIAFAISKDSFNVSSIKIDSSFIADLKGLTSVMENNSYAYFDQKQFDKFKSQSYTLYTKLISPSEAHLRNKELIIIPDKELLSIPFEVLLTHDAKDETHYRSLPYLINDYPISYSYSSEWLFDDRTKSKTTNNLLAIVPSYDTDIDYKKFIQIENSKTERGTLVPIPAALDEAKSIIKTFKGDILEAENASEDNFKKIAGNYSILHFAMHTLIDNKNPMFSKLVFTPGKADSVPGEDNMLNTYEVFNLDLNAQMVVLSSCKSGYGTIQKGEGIMSMARGFIFAGCPSLVITLWSIDDMASADLMSSYYQNLADGMNKATAMQMAKKAFLKNADPIHVHPHFWASHILIGDTQKIKVKNNHIPIYMGLTIILIITLWGLFRRKINSASKVSRQPAHSKIPFAPQ